MDPNLMIKLMDPSVRKDPQAMKGVVHKIQRDARQMLFRSMRVNQVIGSILGSIFFLVGFLLGLATFSVGREGALVTGILAAVFVPLGATLMLAPQFSSIPPAWLLTKGVKASAVIKEVKSIKNSMGRSRISASLAQITLSLEVKVEGQPSFLIDHKELVPGSDMMRLSIGSAIPIRVSPKNPRLLAIDWDEIE